MKSHSINWHLHFANDPLQPGRQRNAWAMVAHPSRDLLAAILHKCEFTLAHLERTNDREKIPSTHIYPFCHSLLALQNRQPSTMHQSNGEEGRQLVGPWDARREEGGPADRGVCAGHLAIVNSGRCLFGSIPKFFFLLLPRRYVFLLLFRHWSLWRKWHIIWVL